MEPPAGIELIGLNASTGKHMDPAPLLNPKVTENDVIPATIAGASSCSAVVSSDDANEKPLLVKAFGLPRVKPTNVIVTEATPVG